MSKHPAFRQILSDPMNVNKFMRNTIATLLVAMVSIGCSATKEKAPRFVDRVQFMAYDKTQRAVKVGDVEMLDKEPTQPFKTIALLTCEGAFHEEIVMTQAIQHKAKELGADAIVRLDPFRAGSAGGSMYGFSQGVRCLFRAKAIVYE